MLVSDRDEYERVLKEMSSHRHSEIKSWKTFQSRRQHEALDVFFTRLHIVCYDH